MDELNNLDDRSNDSSEYDDLNTIKIYDLLRELKDHGIKRDDPRLKRLVEDDADTIELSVKTDDVSSINIINKCMNDALVIPNFKKFTDSLKDIYHELLSNTDGDIASYIPQLKCVDPDKLAISVCTVDGQRWCYGDCNDKFTIQSCCKPINYCIAMKEHGEELVHRYVGKESSGNAFNKIELNRENIPHNPLINSGAMMVCSMMYKGLEDFQRFESLNKDYEKMMEGIYDVGFCNSTFMSERKTADRNMSIAHLIKECCGFPFIDNVNKIIEFYLQSCSIRLNVDMLSVMAATLANYGSTPFTNQRLFEPEIVKNCLSLMTVAGMYDYSGEYFFKYGYPAKSSVSGAVMIVIPNIMGICVWSPRLDGYGNSVRGVDFSEKLSKVFGYHVYRVKNLHFDYNESKELICYRYCSAIKNNDLDRIKDMYFSEQDPNCADYDNRTPLHIAAAEGNIDCAKFLIEVCDVQVDVKDRWGNTPLDDAKRIEANDMIQYLENDVQKNKKSALVFAKKFRQRTDLDSS